MLNIGSVRRGVGAILEFTKFHFNLIFRLSTKQILLEMFVSESIIRYSDLIISISKHSHVVCIHMLTHIILLGKKIYNLFSDFEVYI